MSEPIKLQDFGGIADSQVNPSPNSFFDLVNLRPLVQSDGSSKALTSRPGIKHLEKLDNPIDGFAYNDFNNVKALLTIGGDNISANPAVYGGIGTAPDVVLPIKQDLFYSLRSFPTLPARGSITIATSPDLLQDGVGKIYSWHLDHTILIGVGTRFNDIHVGDILFSEDGLIVYGQVLAVVNQNPILDAELLVSLSNDIGNANFPVSFKYQTSTPASNVTAGDTITINGTVYTFVSGIPSGNQIQVGLTAIDTTINIAIRLNLLNGNVSAISIVNVVSLTARVAGVAGNSITLAKSGANIVLSGATLTGGAGNSSYTITSISTNTISITGVVTPTNGILKYMIVRNASRSQFAVVTSVSAEIPATLSLTLNKDVQALGWATTDSITFHRSDYNAGMGIDYDSFLDGKYDVVSYPTFLNVDGKNNVGVFGVLDKKYNRPFWVGNIVNRSFFNNNFKFNGLYATSLMDDFSYGPFSSAVHHIKVRKDIAILNSDSPVVAPTGTDGNETYEINFSLVLDGYNETKLLYSGDPYGTATSLNTFQDTNAVNILATDSPASGGTYKVIYARITVPNYEILDRRVTAIRVYGRGVNFGRGANRSRVPSSIVTPYRLCVDIDINHVNWVVSSNAMTIDVKIDNIINTGEFYTDRLGQGFSEDLTKRVIHAAVANGRTFVVDRDNRTTVFFSPINSNGFAMSTLPDSNFIFFNRDQGEILGLYALPDRLLVWKQSSVIVYDITSLPNTGRDIYLSSSDGLIAPQSVVLIDRLVYFLSVTGLRVTDGFKAQSVSLDIQAHLSSYATEDLRRAVAFYDKRSFSYIIQIANDIWAFDIRVNQWRKESTLYTAVDVPDVMGLIKYINKNLLGEMIVYCNNEVSLYEFPRLDGLYMDSFNVDGSNRDVAISCNLENNESIASKLGLDSLMYVNNIYIIGQGIDSLADGVAISVRRNHNVIKSAVIFRNNYIYPLSIRNPLDRFTVALSFSASSQVVIKEIGLYPKVFMRTGSQKVGAL